VFVGSFCFCERKNFQITKKCDRRKGEKKMALKRSALKAMGLTDEQIESVIEMHTDTVTGLKDKLDAAESGKESSDKLKADYDKLKSRL
jgi:hypothetical protein